MYHGNNLKNLISKYWNDINIIIHIYVIMPKKITTTTSLVIVESPAKSKKIEQYFLYDIVANDL